MRCVVGGRTEASAPTEAQQEVQWAGDRKGRPYGSVTRGAVRRAVGDAGPYEWDGGADCHDQFANWSRNDTLQGMRCKIGGRTEASAPTEGYKGCSGYRTGGVEPRPYGGQ